MTNLTTKVTSAVKVFAYVTYSRRIEACEGDGIENVLIVNCKIMALPGAELLDVTLVLTFAFADCGCAYFLTAFSS